MLRLQCFHLPSDGIEISWLSREWILSWKATVDIFAFPRTSSSHTKHPSAVQDRVVSVASCQAWHQVLQFQDLDMKSKGLSFDIPFAHLCWQNLEAVARHSWLVLKHLLRAHQISWSQKSDSESPLAHYLCACLPGGSGGMPDMCPGTGGGCEPTLKAPEVDTSAGVSTAGTWHAFFVHCWTKVSGLRPVLWPCRGFACWACQAPSVKDKDHQACGDAGNNVHGSVMNMGYGPIPCTALLLKLELYYVKIRIAKIFQMQLR